MASVASAGACAQRALQCPHKIRTRHVAAAARPSSVERTLGNTLSCGLAVAISAVIFTSSADASQSYLKSTGARGILPDAEQELLDLRFEAEAEAQRELSQLRSRGEALEAESKQAQVGLCATPFGVDVVGITETVALVGAVVSGVSARRRKNEVEKLNEQLRQVNQQLRQQARVGTLYAPSLSYAPSSVSSVAAPRPAATIAISSPPAVEKPEEVEVPHGSNGVSKIEESPATNSSAAVIDSLDEQPLDECRSALREGKKLLKEGNGASAMVRFEKALLLSRSSGNKVQERRAMRGMAASSKLMGNYKKAITYLERVLELSKTMNDNIGDADAYGVIADCYTELNDYGTAAEYYDRYIEAMAKDGPV